MNAVAERVGFEPTKSFDSALFKSAAINRSATSPAVRIPAAIEGPVPSITAAVAFIDDPRRGILGRLAGNRRTVSRGICP